MIYYLSTICAGITQLVEYLTRNEEVEGSSPFSSSQKSAAMDYTTEKAMDYTTENCLLHIRREVRVIMNLLSVICFDYPLTDTQKIVCLSEDNLRTDDYLLSITRLFFLQKGSAITSPRNAAIYGSCTKSVSRLSMFSFSLTLICVLNRNKSLPGTER